MLEIVFLDKFSERVMIGDDNGGVSGVNIAAPLEIALDFLVLEGTIEGIWLMKIDVEPVLVTNEDVPLDADEVDVVEEREEVWR